MSIYTDKHGFSDMRINDGHWHCTMHRPIEETLSLVKKETEYLGLDKIAVLSYEHASDLGIDNSNNLKALYIKDNGDGKIFSFAAIVHYGDERDNAGEFLRQAKLYYELGFDGIKILEGKTDYHEKFNCKFDSEKYEPMFNFLEEKEFPLVIHVAHFIAFPNPESEKKREEIQTELLNVLKRHPRLKITFAHMFNMAHDRERLTRIMETYPNVSVDLALGGDFIIRFSKDTDGWREFFTKFSDRVIYGTDTYNSRFTEDDDFEIVTRHTPVRKFFESKEPFTATYYDLNPEIYGENVVLNPALLPENIVNDIYINSFIKAFGETPRPTDKEKALRYCEKILEGYRNGELKSCLIKDLPPWLAPEVLENAKRENELALENISVIRKFYSEH